MNEDKKDATESGPGPVKTAQPFSADAAEKGDETLPGGAEKPRPDALGDPRKIAESEKVTQRQE